MYIVYVHLHNTPHRRLCLTLSVLFFHQICFFNSAKYFCTCAWIQTKYTRIFQRKQYGFCHFCRSSLNLVPEIMNAYNASLEVLYITIYAPIIDVWQGKATANCFDKRWHVVCSVLLFDTRRTCKHNSVSVYILFSFFHRQ